MKRTRSFRTRSVGIRCVNILRISHSWKYIIDIKTTIYSYTYIHATTHDVLNSVSWTAGTETNVIFISFSGGASQNRYDTASFVSKYQNNYYTTSYGVSSLLIVPSSKFHSYTWMSQKFNNGSKVQNNFKFLILFMFPITQWHFQFIHWH